MYHLFSSVVRIERPTQLNVGGRPRMVWSAVPGGTAVKCRLDLQFIRPNDPVPVVAAGRAPDRHGLAFLRTSTPLKAGDRLVTVSGPVEGTFEIRTIPDNAVGFSAAHHIEVPIWETNRDLDNLWPSEGQ